MSQRQLTGLLSQHWMFGGGGHKGKMSSFSHWPHNVNSVDWTCCELVSVNRTSACFYVCRRLNNAAWHNTLACFDGCRRRSINFIQSLPRIPPGPGWGLYVVCDMPWNDEDMLPRGNDWPCWCHLGAILRELGCFFGTNWDHFESCWGNLWPCWGLIGAIVGTLGGYLGPPWGLIFKHRKHTNKNMTKLESCKYCETWDVGGFLKRNKTHTGVYACFWLCHWDCSADVHVIKIDENTGFYIWFERVPLSLHWACIADTTEDM